MVLCFDLTRDFFFIQREGKLFHCCVEDVTNTKGNDFEDYFLKRESLVSYSVSNDNKVVVVKLFLVSFSLLFLSPFSFFLISIGHIQKVLISLSSALKPLGRLLMGIFEKGYGERRGQYGTARRKKESFYSFFLKR